MADVPHTFVGRNSASSITDEATKTDQGLCFIRAFNLLEAHSGLFFIDITSDVGKIGSDNSALTGAQRRHRYGTLRHPLLRYYDDGTTITVAIDVPGV